jgi:predicted nucleic acid-binding protein
MIPLRLVIDTDVVVPAVLNPDGPEPTTILLSIT